MTVSTPTNPDDESWRRGAAVKYLFDMARAAPVFWKYRTRTMIDPKAYMENLALAAIALRNASLAQGAVIECGTWKGGMSAGLIETGGPRRCYYFFDSFEGLPPAKDIDGQKAKHYQGDTSSPTYYDNCAASLEDFKQTLSMTGQPPENIKIYKGFFENTLPGFDSPSIAVLRLDGDWYESTMICLEKFWDHVLPGGIILIDDYYAWEGCAKAVHDFLSRRKAQERIYQGPIGRVAFIIKKPPAAKQ